MQHLTIYQRVNAKQTKTQIKLDRFRAKAKKRLCRFWRTADQIPGELLASLAHQIDRIPRIGWVRADSLASEDAKSEIIKLRKKLDKAEASIAKFEINRTDQEGELASGLDELRIVGTIRNHDPNPWYYDDIPCIKFKARIEVISTWNQILRVLARHKQKLFHERDLKDWISEAIKTVLVNDEILPNDDNWNRIWIDVDHEEIEKILTQFCALNIIAYRKSHPYWGFTQKGIFHGSRQQALKKGELYVGESPWCSVLIEEFEKVPEVIIPRMDDLLS